MTGKEVLVTAAAPPAIGRYSQGMRANGMVFSAGQLPVDLSGKIPTTIEEQTC